ncbi:MAG: hypothetical protein KDD84_16795, partial [Caldilineaceae bacterium]|nr:hypothetical protein [Caldilineaceae bacterium]
MRSRMESRRNLRYLLFSIVSIISLLSSVIGNVRISAASAPNVEAQALAQAVTVGPTPILLVVNDAGPSPYGRYLGEILRAEGLSYYDIANLDDVTAQQMNDYGLVLLAETPLTSGQASMFSSYVADGGRLIAMRPDSQIAGLFGLGAAAGTIDSGYMQIDVNAALNGGVPGAGLPAETMQFHGDATLAAPQQGATVLADLYNSATNAAGYPAVTAGSNGAAVAFTYDLARTVVYMRQGNPDNANVDADNDGVLRTIDLFQANPGAGYPDTWVDLDKTPIPQADEQQRLLARLVHNLLADALPLPQMWYFPGTAKTVLIPTGDAHANPTSYYQNEIDSISPYNATISFYLSPAGEPNNASLQSWEAAGYSFGIHPYANAQGQLGPGYAQAIQWFENVYGQPPSRTVRNHQVAWQGWTDAAVTAVSYGMALDTNFYSWGSWLQKQNGSWARGYITGSGQPMKFISDQGVIIPYFQQLTQLIDEQLTAFHELLSESEAIAVSQQMIDASLAGDYAALMTQFHVDYYYPPSSGWAEGTLAYANQRGVPILNADEWLTFVETRYSADYTNLAWNGTTQTLSFGITADNAQGIDLTTVLPLSYAGGALSTVTVDGNNAGFSVQTIKGEDVAFVSMSAGQHQVTAVYDGQTPPTPTAAPTEIYSL